MFFGIETRIDGAQSGLPFFSWSQATAHGVNDDPLALGLRTWPPFANTLPNPQPKAFAMEKFTKLTGVAAPLPIVNIDTDMIIPKQYLKTIARSEPFPGTLGVGIGLMYGFDVPTADTPWLVPQDHYRGECVRADGADALEIEPVAGARTLTPSPTPGWGLHLLDVNVALGNLVAIVERQGNRYLHRAEGTG